MTTLTYGYGHELEMYNKNRVIHLYENVIINDEIVKRWLKSTHEF